MARQIEAVPMRSPVLGLEGRLHRELARFLDTLRRLLGLTSEQVGAVALTAQDATIAATAIIPAVSVHNVLSRVSYSLQITRAATVSSSATLTIGWTRNSVSCSQAFAAVTGNTTATQQNGVIVIYPDAGASVTYGVVYASVGATTMLFALDVRLDELP